MRLMGAKHYQAAAADQEGVLRSGAPLKIIHEPDNEHDPDAYQVLCGPYKLGHIPGYAAQVLRAAGVSGPIHATVSGLTKKQSYLEIDIATETGVESSPPQCALGSPQNAVSGVYAIVNAYNLQAYVGRATDMEERRTQHLKALQSRTHFSPLLQSEWQEAPQRFAFVVIKEVPTHALVKEEEYRIFIYGTNSRLCGYNQGSGFDPNSVRKPPQPPKRAAAGERPRKAPLPRRPEPPQTNPVFPKPAKRPAVKRQQPSG